MGALLALAATVEHPSKHPLACAVGAPARLLDDNDDAPVSVRAAEAAADLEVGGRTAVLVLRDGVPVGVSGIADRLRPDAATTVTALTALAGRTLMLVTGDNPRLRPPGGPRAQGAGHW